MRPNKIIKNDYHIQNQYEVDTSVSTRQQQTSKNEILRELQQHKKNHFLIPGLIKSAERCLGRIMKIFFEREMGSSKEVEICGRINNFQYQLKFKKCFFSGDFEN